MQKNNYLENNLTYILISVITIFLSFNIAIFAESKVVKVRNLNYLIHLGKKEWKIITRAEKIEKVIREDNLPEEQIKKLKLIEDIRNFAIYKLKLNGKNTYTTVYNTEGEPLGYNLTVVPEFSLEPVQWKYPVVGKFPYIGFFDKKKAIKEKEKWKSEDYDTYLRTFSAFSSLGWFKDPFYSPMLNYSEGTIAEIIIHEMLHSTIFLKDQLKFNESLANFVGVEGAKLFLKKKYGSNSDEYQNYINRLHDQKIFYEFIGYSYTELKKLYRQKYSKTEMEKKKIEKFKKLKIYYSTLEFQSPGYIGYLDRIEFNNAFIVANKTYSTNTQSFENLLKKLNDNLPLFISHLKKIPPDEDGFLFISKD